MKLPANLGQTLAAVWLLLQGILTLPGLTIDFPFRALLLSLLAIAAGVLWLLGK